MGWRAIGISESLIRSKTLMELIFNSCGEFQWNPEGPVNQIHSPHMHFGASGIFSDLLRSVQMLKRAWGAESLVKLQPCFLSLRWKTCHQQNCNLGSCTCSEGPALGQNTLMMMMIYLFSRYYRLQKLRTGTVNSCLPH